MTIDIPKEEGSLSSLLLLPFSYERENWAQPFCVGQAYSSLGTTLYTPLPVPLSQDTTLLVRLCRDDWVGPSLRGGTAASTYGVKIFQKEVMVVRAHHIIVTTKLCVQDSCVLFPDESWSS